MALRRMALSASVMALCLASAGVGPARADELVLLPPPAEPAEVVITATDLMAAPAATGLAAREDEARREDAAAGSVGDDIARLMPPPVEPADVVLDIIPNSTDIARLLPDPAEPAPVDLGALGLAKLGGSDPIATSAITPAAPDMLAIPASRLQGEAPSAEALTAALPPLPEAAPLRLDDIAPVPPQGPAAAPSTATPSTAMPVAGPAPVERASAEALKPLIAAGLADLVKQPWLPEADQRAIAAHYESRGHAALWHDGEGLTPAGEALRAQLARAADDGLRPADYALPRLLMPRPADLAAADVRLSTLAARYARDARGARINPRRLSALITPKLELPSAGEVLERLGAPDADPAAVLASFQPPHAGYRALRAKLAETRAAQPAREPEVRIPSGPAIRIGMRDDRIALVRARFGFAPDGVQVHDRALATVVAGFQRDNNLPASGILNRATIDALNGGTASAREADLIASMERWRWLPADLGSEHLIVNVPEYMMRKIEDGQVVHASRVVVGKSERPTPIFSDMMDHLVVNPSWTIPPTILKQDILPKLATDPGYAERRGYEVIRRGDRITVRQPPGPSNALGNIKFMFPNDHAVYLHDTPSRNLFASARRAYSSGCVRVERPLKLAELVLGGPENGWSERRLQGMVGSGERTIKLTRRLPIHIVYMTQVVDEAGELRNFEDIYGFHRRTREALGL